ncbi:growth hormone secretagogue receptor a isoform X2 [Electrophorus electricus]|uniref:growth hormone secretagogue receptor a isoform X2 n=1 Tax=Electrophorus electricus TaxID=8005 RepID=UPI0015D0283E|nr:growth hormone secretagogue receptor a isoform X2 [Electrophorus electricus]
MYTCTNNSNCSINSSWDDNATLWESEHPVTIFPVPVLIGVTVTCVVFFLAGVSGNLMTILVVTKYKDMRTTTNLYLSSMAFSDLLIFLCMPLDLYRIWRYRPWNFGNALCKLFQFISECCTYSTILNITALSVERYFAICFPLRAKVVVTKGRVRGVILFLWTLSFVSAGPVVVLVGVEHENGTNSRDTNECKATEYAISLIGRKLWKRKKETAGTNLSSRDKNNRQTVKMLAVVVFAFVLCWLPFHVGRYLISKSSQAVSPIMSLITQYCSIVSFVLFYLSAAINPILYNIMSKKYRIAACRLLSLRRVPRKHASAAKGESSPGLTESSISL